MKSFSLKSRWIDARDEHYPSPQDKLKFDDKVEFPSGYSPPNFYNQLLIYSLEIFKQVSKFFFLSFFIFFFFRKENSRPFFLFLSSFFFFFIRATNNLSPQINPSFRPNWIYTAPFTPDRCLSRNHRNFRSRFFADQHRGRATPARFGYSLNSIVYLLITVTDISIWCLVRNMRGKEEKEERVGTFGGARTLLCFFSLGRDAKEAWKKNIASIWQVQEKFNTILTYY